jgi:FkbM family methyltransferase
MSPAVFDRTTPGRWFVLAAGLGLAAVGGAPLDAWAQPATRPAAPAAAGRPAARSNAVAIACPPRGAFGAGGRYYSQFYEDYILAYVFRGTPAGLYVDVGANDPDQASVTRLFYEKGWRGVNVEPNPELLARLKQRRPKDVNLGVGISDAAATLTFFKFETRAHGLSTFDPEIAKRHRAAGYAYDELTIPVVTLTEALAKSGLVTGGFDFLNVDVEGFERRVLSGLDFARHPPRVLVIEATAPLTEQATQHQWENLVFAKGYTFALDDGLNRYYVRRSERDLQERFLQVAYCVGRDKRAKGVKLDGFMPEPGQ